MFEATPGTPKDLTGEPEPKFEDSEQMSIQHLNNIPEIGKMTQEIEDGKTKTFAASSDEENGDWTPNGAWATSWKSRLPLQTIMRLLQVLVPQVEKICLDKQISDENDILKFIQQGTLVGLLPVPHPILIRRYQTNLATNRWLQTYTWGVIYLRHQDPPIWYDTDVKLFEIQKY